MARRSVARRNQMTTSKRLRSHIRGYNATRNVERATRAFSRPMLDALALGIPRQCGPQSTSRRP